MPPRQRRRQTSDPQRTIFLLEQHENARDSLLDGMFNAIRTVLRLLLTGRLVRADAQEQITTLINSTRQNVANLKWAQLDNLGEDRVHGDPTPETWDDEEDLVARMVENELSPEELQGELEEEFREIERETVQKHGGSSPAVIGYRRVPHPELSKGGTCGLCVLASTRIYKRGNLKDMHGNCRCTVTEVTATHDPGDALNQMELGDLYSDIGGTDGHEAHKVRYKRDPSGRLVRYEDPKQRSPENDPDEVGRKRRTDRQRTQDTESTQRRITELEREVAAYERRLSQGEDVALELESARRRLAQLRRQTA